MYQRNLIKNKTQKKIYNILKLLILIIFESYRESMIFKVEIIYV